MQRTTSGAAGNGLGKSRLCEHVDGHSEQARAPHANEPRDVFRCGALSLLQKPLHYKGEFSRNRAQLFCVWALAQLLLAPAFNSQGCAQAAFRGGARCASQVLDRGAQADARGAMHVLDRGVQAVARCVVRCALHLHGLGAKTVA